MHPRMTLDRLGFVPHFLSENDPRPAREQIHDRYAHGGGWNPFGGFKLDTSTLTLRYPGDPPLRPLAMTELREERLYFYDHAILMIIQTDGSFEVSRVD